MTLSLLKTTNGSASGNYTPNCLLNGLFDLTLGGDITIKPPSNCADGQFFSVALTPRNDEDTVTWDDCYRGGSWPVGVLNMGCIGVNIFMYYQGFCLLVNTVSMQLVP